MSDFTVTMQLKIEKGAAYANRQLTKSGDLTATDPVAVGGSMTVPTVAEAIPGAKAGGLFYAYLPATATYKVQLGMGAAGNFVPVLDLNPGDPPAFGRFSVGSVPAWQADTAAQQLEFYNVEA